MFYKHLFLALLATLLYLCHSFNVYAGEDKFDVSKASVKGSVYVACYFGTAGNNSWQWGLSDNDDYFTLTGYWGTTPLTKIKKFFTVTPAIGMQKSCENAKNTIRKLVISLGFSQPPQVWGTITLSSLGMLNFFLIYNSVSFSR